MKYNKRDTSPEHPWFKEKKYLHFDFPISKENAEKYVNHFTQKPEHNFYPFITFILKLRKVTRIPVSERTEIKKSLKFKRKERPLAYCAHRDRAIYSYYAHKLSESYEEFLMNCIFSESIFAFRKLGKSNVHFAKEVFDEIRKHDSCLVIAMDVKSFFDNLDHKIIKEQWKTILSNKTLPKDHYQVFKAITKYSEVPKKDVYKVLGLSNHHTDKNLYRLCDSKTFRQKVRPIINKHNNPKNRKKGIPQGSPISALLSNIYMIDFDKKAYELANSVNGHYYRYCDDILFVLPDKELGDSVFYEDEINRYIAKINLALNKDKTEIFHFDKGKITNQNKSLQYLGFTFDGTDILLRSAGLQKCYSRIRKNTRLASRTRSKKMRQKSLLARNTLHKKKLYKDFSHFGKRNYISYALRASNIMDSAKIKNQVKPVWCFLNKEIDKWDNKFRQKFFKAKFSPRTLLLTKGKQSNFSDILLRPYSESYLISTYPKKYKRLYRLN